MASTIPPYDFEPVYSKLSITESTKSDTETVHKYREQSTSSRSCQLSFQNGVRAIANIKSILVVNYQNIYM